MQKHANGQVHCFPIFFFPFLTFLFSPFCSPLFCFCVFWILLICFLFFPFFLACVSVFFKFVDSYKLWSAEHKVNRLKHMIIDDMHPWFRWFKPQSYHTIFHCSPIVHESPPLYPQNQSFSMLKSQISWVYSMLLQSFRWWNPNFHIFIGFRWCSPSLWWTLYGRRWRSCSTPWPRCARPCKGTSWKTKPWWMRTGWGPGALGPWGSLSWCK